MRLTSGDYSESAAAAEQDHLFLREETYVRLCGDIYVRLLLGNINLPSCPGCPQKMSCACRTKPHGILLTALSLRTWIYSHSLTLQLTITSVYILHLKQFKYSIRLDIQSLYINTGRTVRYGALCIAVYLGEGGSVRVAVALGVDSVDASLSCCSGFSGYRPHKGASA